MSSETPASAPVAASPPPAPPAPPARFVTKQYKTVHGKRMAYVEVGTGDPIVFLHGNPTSSYLWRNVMPHLEQHGRLIAPDLIGMGDSDKLDHTTPDAYSLLSHSTYLFALLDLLHVHTRITLVLHDWGSALGFMWAHRHRDTPGALRGLAFMEAIVASAADTTDLAGELAPMFDQLRSAPGEELVLERNAFVEQILPAAIVRPLTEAEMAEYRRPFLAPGEGRRPTLTWPREVPVAGEPAGVVAIVQEYAEWLGRCSVPKLFVNAESGVLLTGARRELVRSWPEVTEVTVKGIHFVQEDSPVEIGQAIAQWLPK